MPKSTTTKNSAIKVTVATTVIVEFVNSLRLGQDTFFISRETSLKNDTIFTNGSSKLG